MEYCNHGIYFNEDEGRRLVKFLGLHYRNGTPSDIDGCFDCYGNGWIFLEAKRKDTTMAYGQELMYTRLASDLARGGKFAVVILFDHEAHDIKTPIVAKDCVVRRICINGNWRDATNSATVEQVFDYMAPRISNNMTAMIK